MTPEEARESARDDEPPVERGDVVTVEATDSRTGSAIGPDGYCMVVEVSKQETYPFPDETGWEATVEVIGPPTRSDRSTWGCSNLSVHDGQPICGGCGEPCGVTNAGDGPHSHCCGHLAFT